MRSRSSAIMSDSGFESEIESDEDETQVVAEIPAAEPEGPPVPVGLRRSRPGQPEAWVRLLWPGREHPTQMRVREFVERYPIIALQFLIRIAHDQVVVG